VFENRDGSAKKLFAEYPPGAFIELPVLVDPVVDDPDEEVVDELDDDVPGALPELSNMFFNILEKQAVGHPQLELLDLSSFPGPF